MPTPTDVARFLRCQAFGKTFVPEVDLSGKTVIVTGANSGLGLDACRHLIRLNVSRLILAVRNPDKGTTAVSSLRSLSYFNSKTTTLEVWSVDLDDWKSVKTFCQRVSTQLDRLDGFIANAGLELTKFETSQNLERTLTINVVSTYYMALAVRPKLEETATNFRVDTHLSIIGSLIHYFGPDAQLVGDTPLQNLSDAKTADMAQRYPLSKLMVHLLFREFLQQAPRTENGNQVIINLVNPGWCGTDLGRSKDEGVFERGMFRLIGRTSEEGSRTLVHGVTAGRETHGEYLSECQIKPQSSYMQSDKGRSDGSRLWKDVMVRIDQIHAIAV